MKTFWRTFVKSLTSPGYYKDVLSARFSFSLKYFLALLFLTAFLFGLKIAGEIAVNLPKIPGFVDQTKKEILTVYPEELILTVKDQKISTNVNEPYFVRPLKEEVDGNLYFLTIDTKADIADYQSYRSIILLTETSLVFPRQEVGYQVIPLGQYLRDVPDGMKIDKSVYQEAVKKGLPYLDYLPAVARWGIILSLTALPLISAVFGAFWKMFYLLFFAALFFILLKIARKKISFPKVYQLSMHGLTVPVTASLVATTLGINPVFWGTPIFVIWMILVLRKNRRWFK